MDRPSKMICILIWLVLLTEMAAWYAALKWKNNMPVYTIYGFLEIALICLYFNYSIRIFRKRNIGIYIAAVLIFMGILNTLFLQEIRTLNTNYIFLECISIVFLSLFSIYRLIIEDNSKLNLKNEVHFWIPCILLLEWCGNFLSWGLYDYFLNEMKESVYILNYSLYVMNSIVYLAFGFVFFLYPKMKSAHV